MVILQGPPAPKRQRGPEGTALTVYQPEEGTRSKVLGRPLRSSSLPTPTLKLTGHTGSIYQVQYSPNGATLCSTSFDKTCLLWSHSSQADADLFLAGVEEEEENDLSALHHSTTSSSREVGTATYDNFAVVQGHKNAVLDCAWCDEDCLVTASADKTVMLWDCGGSGTATRLRKWAEHTGIVNAVDRVSETTVISASDDRTCRLWDRRQKRPAAVLTCDFPVLAVAAAVEHHQIFTSGIDPKIYAWDWRRFGDASGKAHHHPIYSMAGHGDTVTSLAVHPGAGNPYLLSNSMDQTLRSWDIRPFLTTNKRHCKTFQGHVHSAEKGLLKCAWSADGSLLSAGSSDGRVHIWDEVSAQELYDLPGHKGCVNAVAFHPVETTVIASGGSDKQIFVGELS